MTRCVTHLNILLSQQTQHPQNISLYYTRRTILRKHICSHINTTQRLKNVKCTMQFEEKLTCVHNYQKLSRFRIKTFIEEL